jgi:hypothetical protein
MYNKFHKITRDIKNRSEQRALNFYKLYTSCMDIKHKLCKHFDQSHNMQRLYKRDNGRFVPVGWMCPDCGQMQKD